MTTAPTAAFIPRFCASLKREILFVRTKNGTYSKYIFNKMTNQFLTTNCSDCHVVPSETDLFPLYAAWSNRLERYVIFVKNALNGKVEQYVYEKDYEGFQQVSQPELQFDASRTTTASDFFTVGGTEKEGVTRIQRDVKGHFRKEQMNWGTKQFEQLPAVPVKLLAEVERNSLEDMIPMTVQVPVEKMKEIISELGLTKNHENSKENQILRVNTVRITAPLKKRKTDIFGDFKREDVETKPVEEPKEPPKKPMLQLQQQRKIAGVGTKTKLSMKDIAEIRRLAALMGNSSNPCDDDDEEEDSSDDADYTTASDEDDVAPTTTGGGSFDVVESSC